MISLPLCSMCMYDLVVDLSGVFSEYKNLHVPVISHFKSKGSPAKMSQNQFVFQKDPWGIGAAGVLFDMHKDTYLLSIFSERERRRWRVKCSRNHRCCHGEIWCGPILIIDICFFMHPEKQGLSSIKELFKWPSTVHVFLQFCCGNMRTHTDISITYARLRVDPVDAITVCAILSHSESRRLLDRHT